MGKLAGLNKFGLVRRVALSCVTGVTLVVAGAISICPARALAQDMSKLELEGELPKSAWKTKKKLRLEYRTQIEMEAAAQENGNHDYSIKNAVGAHYTYSRELRFAVFLPFRAVHKSRTGALRDGQYHVSDAVIGTDYKPRFEPGFFNEVIFIQSLHLPTSEEARTLTKSQGSLSNVIVASHKVSRTVDFRLNEEGALFNQTMGWYSDGKRKTANYQSSVSEYGEFGWSPFEDLTFSQYFGYVHTWFMRAPTGPLVSHEAYLETSVSYNIHHNATLFASYRNSADTENPDHNWSPYRPDESTVVSALKLMY